VTTAYNDLGDTVLAAEGVYVPQQDSYLLLDLLGQVGAAAGQRVADLCTGSGVLAIGAAQQGAAAVTAFDICPRAVRCARANALAAGVQVDVHLGSWTRALEFRPFDIVVCNPPYVPTDGETIAADSGPAWAWDAGTDGRLVLDPLCEAAPALLDDGGIILLVQSEFSDVDKTLASLRSGALDTEVIARQLIPFGPVLAARAGWLERTGRLPVGRREEELVVIRAEKR
jgi:release factor glutamine methyltransferase